MKVIGMPVLAGSLLSAQTTASIQGKIVDAKTAKAIPAAWVFANRTVPHRSASA